MAIEIYLAMSAAGFHREPLPERAAWMACHFSPCSPGLSNLPPQMPAGSLLILDDSLPMDGHDPERILKQLKALTFDSLMLDLQRPASEESRALVRSLWEGLGCPVAVPEQYAGLTSGPVLLPPVPPHRRPEDHLKRWVGRELWLELVAEGAQIILTAAGAEIREWEPDSSGRHKDDKLCCSYDIRVESERAIFNLQRDREDLVSMLRRCESLGVTKAIGMYQEFA